MIGDKAANLFSILHKPTLGPRPSFSTLDAQKKRGLDPLQIPLHNIKGSCPFSNPCNIPWVVE
jgi:hypothetical protein